MSAVDPKFYRSQLALRWQAIPGEGAHAGEWMVVDTWGQCPPIEAPETGFTRMWPTGAAATAYARNLGDRSVG